VRRSAGRRVACAGQGTRAPRFTASRHPCASRRHPQRSGVVRGSREDSLAGGDCLRGLPPCRRCSTRGDPAPQGTPPGPLLAQGRQLRACATAASAGATIEGLLRGGLRRGDQSWGKQGEPRFGEDTALQPVMPAHVGDTRGAAEWCGDPGRIPLRMETACGACPRVGRVPPGRTNRLKVRRLGPCLRRAINRGASRVNLGLGRTLPFNPSCPRRSETPAAQRSGAGIQGGFPCGWRPLAGLPPRGQSPTWSDQPPHGTPPGPLLAQRRQARAPACAGRSIVGQTE
jgi:hypothetical protein